MNKTTKNQMLVTSVITDALALLFLFSALYGAYNWILSLIVLGRGAFMLICIYTDPILRERAQRGGKKIRNIL